MYNFLMLLLFTAIYLLGTQVNKYLFIAKIYKHLLTEGYSNEDAYEKAKFQVKFELKWILLSQLSWATTIVILLYKVYSYVNKIIEKIMKKIITK